MLRSKTAQPFCAKCAPHIIKMCPACLTAVRDRPEQMLRDALTVVARRCWRRVYLSRGTERWTPQHQHYAFWYLKGARKYHNMLLAVTGGVEPDEVKVQRLKAEAKLALLKVQGAGGGP